MEKVVEVSNYEVGDILKFKKSERLGNHLVMVVMASDEGIRCISLTDPYMNNEGWLPSVYIPKRIVDNNYLHIGGYNS